MAHEAGIEAATFAVMLKMQLKDFGSQDDKGDFCCTYDQMELLETQSGLAAEEAIKAYLSASGMVIVPREPTPKMQQVVSANWGRRTWEEFGNVLQAAPNPFKSKP